MNSKDLVHRLAYEFITSDLEEDFLKWEFIDDINPHKTLDKLINYFIETEEYEKCNVLQKLKRQRHLEDKEFNL